MYLPGHPGPILPTPPWGFPTRYKYLRSSDTSRPDTRSPRGTLNIGETRGVLWKPWKPPPRDGFLRCSWSGTAHLVDGEADGEEVGPELPVLSPVLLHQGHQEAADHLRVFGVIVLLQELQTVLWVGPESICAPQKGNVQSDLPLRERAGREMSQREPVNLHLGAQ